jgi:hypothetical protein
MEGGDGAVVHHPKVIHLAAIHEARIVVAREVGPEPA